MAFQSWYKIPISQTIGHKPGKLYPGVDECHNIVDVATEVNSDKLIPYFLTSCIKDLQSHRLPEKYWKFVSLIRNDLAQSLKDLKKGTQVDPNDYLDRICKNLKFENKAEFFFFHL